MANAVRGDDWYYSCGEESRPSRGADRRRILASPRFDEELPKYHYDAGHRNIVKMYFFENVPLERSIRLRCVTS